jgi:ABC transport system ATP-binding/permease protein
VERESSADWLADASKWAGVQPPDVGRVTHTGGLHLGLLSQHEEIPSGPTGRTLVLGDRADHEWAARTESRDVVENGTFEGARPRPLSSRMTGGSSMRCTSTWELHDATVDSYEGGYAAFVLAKAERLRRAEADEVRRRNLIRKELAWLRRGPPARTSKPRFRTDAANALIADEPPARDSLALTRIATARLGKDVLDLEDASIALGGQLLLDRETWPLGPGDRVGLVGVNGSGKTTVLRVLAGELALDSGRLRRGRTVRVAHLTQARDNPDPDERVLEPVEKIRRVSSSAAGREISATSVLERFGFNGDALTARIGELSGGERRRLRLLQLILEEPNVLLLDEPTNDLDIETLNVVEDFLDGWPGTLVVVSHDRYFLERVCNSVCALLGDGHLVMLPGGIDEYLKRRGRRVRARPAREASPEPSAAGDSADISAGAVQRTARKELARIERQLSRLAAREALLHKQMAIYATDHVQLGRISTDLHALKADRDELELRWLAAAETAEG